MELVRHGRGQHVEGVAHGPANILQVIEGLDRR